MLSTLLVLPFLLSMVVVGSLDPRFSPLLPEPADYMLSEEQIKQYFFTDSQAASPIGRCNSVPFSTAQAGFANAVGLPPTTTWRDGVLLTNATFTLIDTGIDGLAAVCGARQLFAQTLGASYDACVNRYFLLGQGATTFNDVIYYTHLMRHLEFICSTGLDVYQRNLDCIRKGETTDGNQYKACFYKFNATVNANPNQFCQSTQVFMGCIKDFFTQECNQWVGWMECEMERVGFAWDCVNLAC